MSKLYRYIFYQFYQYYQRGYFIWSSEWRASFSLDVLWYWFIASLVVYYKVFFNRYYHFSENIFDAFCVVLIVTSFNYYLFHRKNKWKQILQEFDKLPKKKKIVGGWLVLVITIVILTNLCFSIYLMSKVDWSVYRVGE